MNVLITASFMTLSSLATFSIIQNQQNAQKAILFRSNVIDIRDSLVALLGSDAAWAITKSQSTDMKCLTPTQTYCVTGGGARLPISVYGADGNVVLSAAADAGYGLDGVPCTGYTTAGNDACPLHATVLWRAECDNSACSSSKDFLSITFTYSPSTKANSFAFNPVNYNVVEKSRITLGSVDSPVIICANKGMAFIGEGKSFNSVAADSEGCVPLTAFMGAQGPTGATGPAGASGLNGLTGPRGANGADAMCPSCPVCP